MEIERKYLIDPVTWERVEKPEGRRLVQGYLCTDERKVIRIRTVQTRSGMRGYLTIKGQRENLGRQEFEYEIPESEARALLTLSRFPLIEKTRFKYLFRGKVWDVDIFHGINEGLCMAEIELADPDEPIEFPEWAGEEVSDDPRYYNAYLAAHPFTTWK